jgi:hypothetical protein
VSSNRYQAPRPGSGCAGWFAQAVVPDELAAEELELAELELTDVELELVLAPPELLAVIVAVLEPPAPDVERTRLPCAQP